MPLEARGPQLCGRPAWAALQSRPLTREGPCRGGGSCGTEGHKSQWALGHSVTRTRHLGLRKDGTAPLGWQGGEGSKFKQLPSGGNSRAGPYAQARDRGHGFGQTLECGSGKTFNGTGYETRQQSSQGQMCHNFTAKRAPGPKDTWATSGHSTSRTPEAAGKASSLHLQGCILPVSFVALDLDLSTRLLSIPRDETGS